MATGLSAHFLGLVQDCLLKSFWHKAALKAYLRRSGVSESFLAQLSHDELKRQWLDRLFPKLEQAERGALLSQRMARDLASQTSFPDLEHQEDSAKKLADAKEAVKRLKDYLGDKDDAKAREQEASRRRKEAAEAQQKKLKSQIDLSKLRERLEGELLPIQGTQKGGYDFQVWFYDMMDYFDVDNRRPYVAPDGRQIDGSITIDGTTYLGELKFTSEQSGATDIDSLFAKVTAKADNTMGLLVSMSGYSSVAITQASHARSPILLLDSSHLYMVLTGIRPFPDVVRRIRRHSSQEGKAYLPVNEFGGKQ